MKTLILLLTTCAVSAQTHISILAGKPTEKGPNFSIESLVSHQEGILQFIGGVAKVTGEPNHMTDVYSFAVGVKPIPYTSLRFGYSHKTRPSRYIPDRNSFHMAVTGYVPISHTIDIVGDLSTDRIQAGLRFAPFKRKCKPCK